MRSLAVPALLLLALLAHLFLRASLRELYRPWARVLLGLAAIHGSVAYGLLGASGWELLEVTWFRAFFLVPAAVALISLFLLVVGAPVWFPLSLFSRRRAAATGEGLTRRQLLRAAAVLPPATLAATGPAAAVVAASAPVLRSIELTFPSLPPELDGLKVVQISDVHVGAFVTADDVAAAAERIQRERPDLFLVTGDLIDDLGQLDATMEALGLVQARLGSFACLGNHEYYAGVANVRAAFERSRVRLLVDERARLAPGLEVSGADYPIAPGRRRDPTRFEAHALGALGGRDPEAFQLHLVHHPDGWDAARAHGADLTLSGHTHGGQIALGPFSLASAAFRYPRGPYQEGARRLFVTSGFGHWVPVRLGCPPEIVVATLRRA